MLILSRKLNEGITVNGNIFIKILQIDKDKGVKLGITAPVEIPVHRDEIQDKINKQKENLVAA
jgi:carbon storage regulator